MTCLSRTPSQEKAPLTLSSFIRGFWNFLYVGFHWASEDPSQTRNLCLDWLQPETCTKEEIIEILVLEQYLAILPERIKPWVCAQKPETREKLVTLLEHTRRCTSRKVSRGGGGGPCWGR